MITLMITHAHTDDQVINQAKQDALDGVSSPSHRHWVAVELLMDRAFTLWSKRVFNNLTNLSVVQGNPNSPNNHYNHNSPA